MSYLSEQDKQLEIKLGIRQAEDELLTAIQTVLDDKASYGNLEDSQFRNLLRISETTESTEVIKNYLRYQLGRDKKWGGGKNSLATIIIQDIDGKIQELARKIAQEAKTDDFKSIWLELIRLYLSYGVNYLQLINSSHLIHIEQSISRLSRENQLCLIERIIHSMRISNLNYPANIQPEIIEKQLANMANDPAIQAELISIEQEFANTEMDGLLA